MNTALIAERNSTSPRIPVLRPLLPAADRLLPYLREIDEQRFYSNSGPLMKRLERRLAEHFELSETQIGAVGNGTTALSAALIAIGAKPGLKCLVPAWTFVASAAAIWAANLVPHFVDVSPQTWMLDPADVRKRSDLADVGAVMVVSPFGAPVPTAAWDDFWNDTGIPVVIDGAACFDTVQRVPAARPGRAPIMISMHATKVYGIGEGGLILSTDDTIVHRARQICNFGIWGSPEGQILGYNGKLSEYHAAVGLAALDGWPERRADIARLTATYRTAIAEASGVTPSPDYGNGWVSSYANVAVGENVHIVVDRLDYMGIETRRWWRDGIHAQVAYRKFPHDALPVTDDLAGRVLGLPFFHDLSDQDVARVFRCLASALHAPA